MTRPLTEKNYAELSAQLEATGAVDMSKLSPGPKRRNNQETADQCYVIKWWGVVCAAHNIPEFMLCSIPNGGGKFGGATGAILKRMGLRKGAPDLMLLIPRGNFHALFVEMKTEVGVCSDEQELFHGYLVGYGYRVRVCRSAQAAITEIENYLKL